SASGPSPASASCPVTPPGSLWAIPRACRARRRNDRRLLALLLASHALTRLTAEEGMVLRAAHAAGLLGANRALQAAALAARLLVVRAAFTGRGVGARLARGAADLAAAFTVTLRPAEQGDVAAASGARGHALPVAAGPIGADESPSAGAAAAVIG